MPLNPELPYFSHSSEQEPQQIFWPEIPSTIEAAMEYQNKMENLLQAQGWDEEAAYQVAYAFQEMLKNAIIHGNLGLKKSPGEEEEDWSKKVIAASLLPENQTKKVWVHISLTSRKIIVEIQDQGKDSGRFWENGTTGLRTGADTQWKSGRGLMISEAFLNQIIYEKNEQGIKTTLIRDLDIPINKKSE